MRKPRVWVGVWGICCADPTGCAWRAMDDVTWTPRAQRRAACVVSRNCIARHRRQLERAKSAALQVRGPNLMPFTVDKQTTLLVGLWRALRDDLVPFAALNMSDWTAAGVAPVDK